MYVGYDIHWDTGFTLTPGVLWKAGRGGASSGVIASLAEAVGYESF